MGGCPGGGGELVAVGKLSMDLSLYGQSRDAEGRHRAARPGLGAWVGARVASPRCPILRPGSPSGFGTPATWQFRAGSPARATGPRDSPGIACLDREDVQGSPPTGGLSPWGGAQRMRLLCNHMKVIL